MPVLLLLLAAATQAEGERILTTGRVEVTGSIVDYRSDGVFSVRTASGGTRRLTAEEVLRIDFHDGPAEAPGAGRIRLRHGGVLSGKVSTPDASTFAVTGPAGTYRFDRRHVRSVSLAEPRGPLPDIHPAEGRDTFIVEVKKKVDGSDEPVLTLAAEYGRLESIGETVRFVRDGEGKRDGEVREFPRDRVQEIRVASPVAASSTRGRYAKLHFRNGDRLVGVLRGADERSVTLFSHLFGVASVPKKALRSITFVAYPRMGLGHLLICESGNVREFDREGRELWRYGRNVYAQGARRLENGNILIANTSYNQVLEVRPSRKEGGEIVWRLDSANYPMDALPLDNGRILVCEGLKNRIVEIDPGTKAVAWEATVSQQPLSAQRLPNGRTLVACQGRIVELDAAGKVVWQPEVKQLRPWRARRLDNGRTLVTDLYRGQVVEIDAKSRVHWKMEGLSRPSDAVRLDDGNTVILEQGKNRAIEVDPAKRVVRTIDGLRSPLRITTD